VKYEPTSGDEVLIEGCLTGHEDAWEALVTKYERLIYSTCRRYNLPQAESDDVFGRVCLILLQHLESLKDRSRLSSWLITTTSRECWRLKKEFKDYTSTATGTTFGEKEQTGIEEAIDNEPLPEEALLQLERQQIIREALKQLSTRCQKLIWELFYNPAEPSYAQIAAELGIPVTSLGPTRARCLDKLRRFLLE
jgi:RNA polymerase sigma factor (sigma-70 family)